VALGLLPRSLPRYSPAEWRSGVAWATLSALGQGVGAVLSRKAFAVDRLLNGHIDAGTAAYQRAVAGVLVAALAAGIIYWRRADRPRHPGRAWPWVLANALTGPILGVVCFQWALRSTPAGIVQAVIATAPLLVIPLGARVERTHPHLLYYLGTVLAVTGVAGLWLWR
jgi:drug/metabolite transporter (DMT)-like permease